MWHLNQVVLDIIEVSTNENQTENKIETYKFVIQ